MKNNLNSFRDKDIVEGLVKKLQQYQGPTLKLMEVCGSHTMAISKFGIREVLPNNIKLYSGPGCPVCVTPGYYMKSAIELSKREDVIITTFGDLMRIPYDVDSLLHQKALGRDIRIVYSPFDSIEIAKQNPQKKVVFLSVGFETTIPIIASSVIEAELQNVENYYLLTANKTIPVPLQVLASDDDLGIDGYIYPGHVSSIIGDAAYHEVADKYSVPGVITGFEPADILGAIDLLVDRIQNKNPEVINLYNRVVRSEGNPKAVEIMNRVFEPEDAAWRGIGVISNSGMKLNQTYQNRDAWKLLPENIAEGVVENPACICGDILKGKCLPTDCPLYGKVCTPENPVGACMVSGEGTCAAYYRYS